MYPQAQQQHQIEEVLHGVTPVKAYASVTTFEEVVVLEVAGVAREGVVETIVLRLAFKSTTTSIN